MIEKLFVDNFLHFFTKVPSRVPTADPPKNGVIDPLTPILEDIEDTPEDVESDENSESDDDQVFSDASKTDDNGAYSDASQTTSSGSQPSAVFAPTKIIVPRSMSLKSKSSSSSSLPDIEVYSDRNFAKFRFLSEICIF